MSTYPRKLLPNLERFEPDAMDHTATKVWKECPRKYFYRMVLGREQPEGEWASVFAWGTSLHKFLEVLYETGDVSKAIQEGLKLWRAPLSSKPKFLFQTKERWMNTAIALVKMYTDEKSAGNIKVVAIEQPWKVQFPDGTAVGGRFDQLISWNGRIHIRDWKTTSKQLQYFKAGLDPNDQVIRYIYGASALQFGVDENGIPNRVIDGTLFTAIYNTQEPKSGWKEETHGPKIVPITSSRTKSQLAAWIRDQQQIHKAMQLSRETDVWPMHEHNCGWCPYRMVCTQPSEAAMENTLKHHYLLKPWKHEQVDQKEHE